jgi:hypothetical protein
MRHPSVEIENIEQLRRQEGIDDVELRDEIRRLHPGNMVKISLVTGPNTRETLKVRITSINGTAFRGKLVDRPTAKSLDQLQVGSPLTFTAEHIHSIPKAAPVARRPQVST